MTPVDQQAIAEEVETSLRQLHELLASAEPLYPALQFEHHRRQLTLPHQKEDDA